MYRRVVPAALLVLLVAGATACGTKGSEPEVAFTVPPKAGATLPGQQASSTTVPKNCIPATVTPPAADQKPVVDKQQPPTALVKTDVKVGDGAEATVGATVKMEYVGVLQKDGTEFDSSWSRNAEPFEFTLGQGMVIPGWDQGIPGMKVGGRRVLVIPANLAYGAQDKGKIPANSDLVFVVDLLQVCAPAAPTSSVSLPAGLPTTTAAAGAPTTTAAGAPTTVAPTTAAPTTAAPTTAAPTTTKAP